MIVRAAPLIDTRCPERRIAAESPEPKPVTDQRDAWPAVQLLVAAHVRHAAVARQSSRRPGVTPAAPTRSATLPPRDRELAANAASGEALIRATPVRDVGVTGGAYGMPTCQLGFRAQIATRRSESGNGNARSMAALMTLKMAVVAPTPSASVRTAAAAKPGCLRTMRTA